MAIDDEIQQLLEILWPLYQDIQQKRARLSDLETVPLAKDDYEKLLVQEDEQLARLQNKKETLEEEYSRLIQAQKSREDQGKPKIALSKRKGPQSSFWNRPQSSNTNPAVKKEKDIVAIDRDQVKTLVNRWQFVWKIDPVILGQFNRIVDNVERPVGEAIMLLDWNIFCNRMYAWESSQAHLERLTQWHTALREYQAWLGADIRTQEARFLGWLPVWENWRQTEQPQGHERWQTFIVQSRQAKQAGIRRMELEINELAQEIAQLKEEDR